MAGLAGRTGTAHEKVLVSTLSNGDSGMLVGRGALPSTGIRDVVVNGMVVVNDSKVRKDVYSDQPIRPIPEKVIGGFAVNLN